jgi:hypothetical protein
VDHQGLGITIPLICHAQRFNLRSQGFCQLTEALKLKMVVNELE